MGPDSKRISTDGTTDRLSNLPCNIIGQILALLPLKEAAKTSVLSKKWEDKWLTIPHLVFDERSSESTIYHVLLLHKEPIVKFTIKRGIMKSQTALYDWFNFLSKHKIEELTIRQSYSDPRLVLPCHLFSFYHLKHLFLQGVEVRVPLSMYNGFGNLSSIFFENVIMEIEELQRLIQKCPKLESLCFFNYNQIANTILHISTHNLKSFQFQGTVDFVYIYSNPHLEDVLISYDEDRPDTTTGTVLDYAIKLFGQLSMIKKLQVNCDFLKVLGRSVPPNFPKSLIHLKHIQFENICFDNVNNLKSVLCLIRSSPNLRTLVFGVSGCPQGICLYVHISLFNVLHSPLSSQLELESLTRYLRHWQELVDEDYEDAALQYLKDEQKITIPVSSSLEEVKFDYLYGWPMEMEFVKILLFEAKELRKVEIGEIHREDCEDKFSFARELASFRRASSLAVVLIN